MLMIETGWASIIGGPRSRQDKIFLSAAQKLPPRLPFLAHAEW